MKSVGTKLREARTGKGLTLEDINSRTRISLKNLTALEADDLSKIASPFTYRAFVKQVAETLGISYEFLQAEVQVNSSSMPEPLVPGQEDPAMVSPNQFPFPPPKRSFGLSDSSARWVYRTVSFAAVVGLVSAYLLWRNSGIQAAKLPATPLPSSSRNLEPPPVESQPSPSLAMPAPPPVAPGTEQLLPPASATAQLVPVRSVSAPPPEKPAASSGLVHIQLSATEPTWLSITTDGQTAYTGTIAAMQTKVFSGKESARIKTANAGGTNIIFNGRSLGSLGRHGQVRTFVFTKDGYEVVRGPAAFTPNGG